MVMPVFSMRDLIESGVHFGHKTRRWNPQMAPYIYGVRHDTHIIDLGQTVPMLHRALGAVRDVAAAGGKILFVGTKRQASDPIREAAEACGQFYINHRWLGGLLTNWKTIQVSIQRMRKMEEQLAGGEIGLTKKEVLNMRRNHEKLEKSLGGIKSMHGVPDLIFVIDTNREELAIQEARKLNIPIVSIVDTNCSIEGINFPIPGNDDATRAIQLYCRLIVESVNDGRKHVAAKSGRDMGNLEEISMEDISSADAEKTDEKAKKATATTKKAATSAAGKKPAVKTEESEAAVEVVAEEKTAAKKSAKKSA